jgi:cell wall-associated NlpC family hydrolase
MSAPVIGAVPSVAARLPDRSVPAVSQALSPALAAQIALEYAGAPYVYGGDGPSGFDCSGFVQYVMSRAGRPVPRDLFGQYNAGSHPASLEPGDLVFFQDTYESGLSHVGIFIGNGQFIHAISEERGVGISSLAEPYYIDRWYGSARIP